jgi:glycosyltransferase involved in cell wall biosynthesis
LPDWRADESSGAMRILHVITDLNLGGAEVMLYRLLQAPELEHYSHRVVSLTDLGVMAERLRQLGIPSQALEMSRFPNPLKILRLAGIIRELRPALVQAWMYHANLIGGIAATMTGTVRTVWGIHSCVLEPQRARWTTRWTVALCARLSHWLPDRIVAVSRTSRDQHVASGYDAGKFVVIPNGFELDQYRPDPDCRREARRELGVDPDSVLIGLVARMDPVKDHLNFVRAAAFLAGRQPHVRFLLCGEGTAADESLVRAIGDAGLSGRFLLLGRRDDVPRIMTSLDVATLCSAAGEAFPLAVGEAMACGVPCVVTDVGDCAYLVGETGRVVPPRHPEALAGAWEELVRLGPEGRRHLGLQARQRIEAHFSLPQTAAEYAAVYRDVLANGTADQLLSARAH